MQRQNSYTSQTPEPPGGTPKSRGQRTPTGDQQQKTLHINLPSLTELDQEVSSLHSSLDNLLQTLHRVLHNPQWTYSSPNNTFVPQQDLDASNDTLKLKIIQVEKNIADCYGAVVLGRLHVVNADQLSKEIQDYDLAKQEMAALRQTLTEGRAKISTAQLNAQKWQEDMKNSGAVEAQLIQDGEYEQMLCEAQQIFEHAEEAWNDVLERAEEVEGVVLSFEIHVMAIHFHRLQGMVKV